MEGFFGLLKSKPLHWQPFKLTGLFKAALVGRLNSCNNGRVKAKPKGFAACPSQTTSPQSFLIKMVVWLWGGQFTGGFAFYFSLYRLPV
ncbi:MAG: hypothetical protein ACK5L3_02710 [Oscillospiraceae bacterium]